MYDHISCYDRAVLLFKNSFIVFFSLKEAMHRKYCRFVKKYPFESRNYFYKEHRRKVKREDAVQSVSVDWLEITRSDLYFEICIDKKKKRLHETETLHEYTRQFQCEAYISLAKTACRHFYTEAIRSRMKIDQT